MARDQKWRHDRNGSRWSDLESDAGTIRTADPPSNRLVHKLFELILDVASGRKKPGLVPTAGLHNDLALFNPAPVN